MCFDWNGPEQYLGPDPAEDDLVEVTCEVCGGVYYDNDDGCPDCSVCESCGEVTASCSMNKVGDTAVCKGCAKGVQE